MPTWGQHAKGFATLAFMVETHKQIYADDKLTWSDAPHVIKFGGAMTVLWGSEFLEWKSVSKKPLYILEAIVVAGGVASYAIAGEEGLYDYTDFITGDVSPQEYYDVVMPAIQETITEPFIDYIEELWDEQIVEPLVQGKEKAQRKITGWKDDSQAWLMRQLYA